MRGIKDGCEVIFLYGCSGNREDLQQMVRVSSASLETAFSDFSPLFCGDGIHKRRRKTGPQIRKTERGSAFFGMDRVYFPKIPCNSVRFIVRWSCCARKDGKDFMGNPIQILALPRGRPGECSRWGLEKI